MPDLKEKLVELFYDNVLLLGVWFLAFDCVGYNVTHWMPLPQPPKGE